MQGWGVAEVAHGMQPAPKSGEDPRLKREYYHRTEEEDEELGLDEMKTELGADGVWKTPAHLQKLIDQRKVTQTPSIVDPNASQRQSQHKPKPFPAWVAHSCTCCCQAANADIGGGAAPAVRRARASHILVAEKAACLALREQLDAAGPALLEQFAALATANSICPSKHDGGACQHTHTHHTCTRLPARLVFGPASVAISIAAC